MPITQDRVIALLLDFEQLRNHFADFRSQIKAIAELKVPEAELRDTLRGAVIMYPPLASEAFAIENRHFSRVAQKNRDNAARMAQQREILKRLPRQESKTAQQVDKRLKQPKQSTTEIEVDPQALQPTDALTFDHDTAPILHPEAKLTPEQEAELDRLAEEALAATGGTSQKPPEG